jgi:hypothetical protein
MRGIYCQQASNSTTNIINNFVSLPLTIPGECTHVYGIFLLGDGDFNASVIYNTVYIGGTHVGGNPGSIVSAGIRKSNFGVTGNYTQLNNIVINERTGGRAGVIHVAGFLSNNPVNRLIDYNTYFISDAANSYYNFWDSLLFNNLSEYQLESGAENKSNYYDVKFTSGTDLHLLDHYAGDEMLRAAVIDSIFDDMDEEIRDQYFPYRGADELYQDPVGNPLPVNLSRSLFARNYPNPFNPSTRLIYFLPFESKVRITVLNMLGEVVDIVIDETEGAGNHNVEWNASGKASGVYIWEVQAVSTSGNQEFSTLKKMLLLR